MKKYKLFNYEGEEIGWVELSPEQADSLDGLDVPLWCLAGSFYLDNIGCKLLDLVFIGEEC